MATPYGHTLLPEPKGIYSKWSFSNLLNSYFIVDSLLSSNVFINRWSRCIQQVQGWQRQPQGKSYKRCERVIKFVWGFIPQCSRRNYTGWSSCVYWNSPQVHGSSIGFSSCWPSNSCLKSTRTRGHSKVWTMVFHLFLRARRAAYRTCTKACKFEFQYAAKVVPGGAEKSLQVIIISRIIRGE